MKKTDVIFSFDTEDFTSNSAQDAVVCEAEILREEGVRGGFCLVGLLARQLGAWGREDVREALSHHDLLSHSYGHSLHPTINEYTDVADFSAARAEVLRQETEALRLIEKFTGRTDILGGCPPGNQKSYVAMYAYADMGLPIYADTFCDTADGRGTYYCNIYHTKYTFCMESFFNDDSDEAMTRVLDALATQRRAICYTHPNSAMYSEFWDNVNYYKENKHPFGEWEEAPRRSPADTERFYASIRRFIQRIKADGRFRITSYRELCDRLAKEPPRTVRRTDIPAIREALRRDFSASPTPTLSLSDVFLACRELLTGKEEHVCGKVYGFLKTPYAVTEEVTVTRAEMEASAAAMDTSGFLPTRIHVGDKVLGPTDWLMAALDILAGEEMARVLPKPQLPPLDVLPAVKTAAFRGGWVQSDSFRDEYLSDRLRLQIFTLRFAEEA